jgi:hypothetical protein
MAIGVSKLTPAGAQRYKNVGAAGSINGGDNGTLGTPAAWTQAAGLQVGHSVIFYKIALIDAGSSAVALTSEDDGDNELFDIALRQLGTTPLAYYAVAATGIIHVVMDAPNAEPASVIQARIRALGTTVGANSADISLSTVTLGTSFTVA